MLQAQFFQFFLCNKLIVVVHIFYNFRFDFLCQIIQEGTPFGSRTHGGHIECQHFNIFLSQEEHTRIRYSAEIIEGRGRLNVSNLFALKFNRNYIFYIMSKYFLILPFVHPTILVWLHPKSTPHYDWD